MLTTGNTKLGKDIAAFGLPLKSCTCKTEDCKKYCYAHRGSFLTPNVDHYYKENYKLSQRADFVERMNEEIRLDRPKYIRIHPSGDFYSQEYFEKWNQIAFDNPEVQFLAYTRNYNLKVKALSPNFKIYFSVDATTKTLNPDISLTALVTPVENPQHMAKLGNARICDSKCWKCKACWSGKINIVFPKRK